MFRKGTNRRYAMQIDIIEQLFEDQAVLGVPARRDEYLTKSNGVADNGQGDKCD